MTRRAPQRGMTDEVVSRAAVADDEIVVAGGGFALPTAGAVERHHPRERRPGKCAPRSVSGGPARPDNHPLIVHGPRVAAVAAKRPEVDEAGFSGPGKPVTRACGG